MCLPLPSHPFDKGKIVEKGMLGFSKPISHLPRIPKVLVTNIKQLMMIEKAGVPVREFKTIYEEHFEYINILNLGFKTMIEFCLFLPDILRVTKLETGEYVCHPTRDLPAKFLGKKFLGGACSMCFMLSFFPRNLTKSSS